MTFLYALSIRLYGLLITIASLFVPKARLWKKGRRSLFEELRKEVNGDNIIWFHCASLGEFEQGRPLIEELKKSNHNIRILLTFFSPSGYEIRKNYALADWVFYLPLDTASNAREFISIVNPKKVVFIKYEFWFFFMRELKRRNIPLFLVSAIFRRDQHFFKSYGKWFRKNLNTFTHIFVQDKNSEDLLRSIGITNVTNAGDTRFDRVYKISQEPLPVPVAEAFAKGRKVLVAGSTWEPDEQLLNDAWRSDQQYAMIVAPHEISEDNLQRLEKLFGSRAIRYTRASVDTAGNYDVLIINNIGMLSSLYRYGQVAYIGGGFGKGIHNTLEAATYGVPVIFGPKYEKFREAVGLIQAGGAASVTHAEELRTSVSKFFKDPQAGRKAGEYVKANTGATAIALQAIR